MNLQDSKLLTSISATERVKLWDQFTGPVDQDAIKLEFFRKVHRKNPPFRIKTKLPPRKTAIVPEMVRYHYKKPVAMLPRLRDVLRLECVNKKKNNMTEATSTVNSVEDIKVEHESDTNCDIRGKEKTLDGSRSSSADNVEWTPVNGYLKSETLNGGYFDRELIKKEHGFISDMISGMTTESKYIITFYFS